MHKVARNARCVSPTEPVESALDHSTSRCGVFVPRVATLSPRGAGRAVCREAIHETVLEPVARQEVCGVCVVVFVSVFLSEVQPRRHLVLRPHIRVAISAGVVTIAVRYHLRKATTERAVVAGGHETDEVCRARVDLDYLFVASEAKGGDSMKLAGCEIQHVHWQTDDAHGITLVGNPLLVGDEKVVLYAETCTPLVLVREVGRAQGLHEPVRLRRGRNHDVLPGEVDVAVVRCRAAPIAAPADELSLQVEHFLDGLTRIFDHGVRARRGAILHELRQLRAVEIDEVDVRARHPDVLCAIDEEGEGLLAIKGPIGLTLVDEPHRGCILQVGPVAVRYARQHGSSLLVHLTDRGQDLELSVRVILVSSLAILQQSAVAAGVGSLTDRCVAGTHGLEVHDVRAKVCWEHGPRHPCKLRLHALARANAGQWASHVH
mmetsp:Transcript_36020/g.114501  ORF Transcript_36020/g.114501 Transcript_36020/m.114501 type:complete len:433 (+) Transcript_36020:1166-2464(+)